jgi:hypothetical protein
VTNGALPRHGKKKTNWSQRWSIMTRFMIVDFTYSWMTTMTSSQQKRHFVRCTMSSTPTSVNHSNGNITKYVPKNKHYCCTLSNKGQTHTAVGVDSVGYVDFYCCLFVVLGVEESPITTKSHTDLDTGQSENQSGTTRPLTGRGDGLMQTQKSV